MKYISKLVLLAAISLMGQYAVAQPPARAKERSKKEATQQAAPAVKMTDRAKSQYPTTTTPQEVAWKRDIYRSLDLQKEKNASLYYPVEPMGNSVNLFTYIFRLILDGSVSAYTYNLDGYESFTQENKINPKDLLDNYRIYYEENNGQLTVGKSDIPSSEILSYYIKESYYYDQRTSTYNSRVTAICPVLHRAGEFTSEVTKYPMFWLNYDEISPLLAQQKLVTSSYNNVSAMTMDDYFTKKSYEGEIYKTVNLRNLALNQYCKDTTAIKKEQENIEKQLRDFSTNLWNTPQPKAEEAVKDSTATAEAKEQPRKTKQSAEKEEKSENSKPKKSTTKRSSAGGAKVSVRRTRR